MIGMTEAQLRELFGNEVVDRDTHHPDWIGVHSTAGWEAWPGKIDQIAGVADVWSHRPMVWVWAGYDLLTGQWSFLCAECDYPYCAHCFALIGAPNDPEGDEEILEAIDEAAEALGLGWTFR